MARKRKSSFGVLNPSQQKLIEKYIDFRAKDGKIIYRGFSAKKSVSHKERNLLIERNTIANCFARIIAYENGIDTTKDNWIYNKKFNPNVFKIINISKEDYFKLAHGLQSSTLYRNYKYLRRFYYWILQTFEETVDIDDHEKYKKFLKFDRRVSAFLKQFPKRNELADGEVVIRKEKSFLTREQLITVKICLLKNQRSTTPFKDALCWQICCTTGLRPEEILALKIEYFELDSNSYLKLNKYGWGVLHFPSSASKQGLSPSHHKYGTPVPPSTVGEINKYLVHLYRNKDIPRGEGFLLRPKLKDIHIPLNRYYFSNRINNVKPFLNFLSLKQRKDFELKASRRSMYNLICGINVNLPDKAINREVQKYAGNYQMRHQTKGQSTGEIYYLDSISEEDYYKVLSYTIGFPWNFKELEEWEIKNGYKVDKANLIVQNPVYIEKTNDLSVSIKISDQKEKSLNEINNKLKNLSSRPKDLSMIEWTTLRNSLLRDRDKLLEN